MNYHVHWARWRSAIKIQIRMWIWNCFSWLLTHTCGTLHDAYLLHKLHRSSYRNLHLNNRLLTCSAWESGMYSVYYTTAEYNCQLALINPTLLTQISDSHKSVWLYTILQSSRFATCYKYPRLNPVRVSIIMSIEAYMYVPHVLAFSHRRTHNDMQLHTHSLHMTTNLQPFCYMLGSNYAYDHDTAWWLLNLWFSNFISLIYILQAIYL